MTQVKDAQIKLLKEALEYYAKDKNSSDAGNRAIAVLKETHFCSFCLKPRSKVKYIILHDEKSNNLNICDECVSLCNEVLESKEVRSHL